MVEPAKEEPAAAQTVAPSLTEEERVKMWNESQEMPESGAFDRQLRIQNWN